MRASTVASLRACAQRGSTAARYVLRASRSGAMSCFFVRRPRRRWKVCARAAVASAVRARGESRFALRIGRPCPFAALLRYLAPRCIPGIESVTRHSYRRMVAMGDDRGWIELRQVNVDVSKIGMPAKRALSHPDSFPCGDLGLEKAIAGMSGSLSKKELAAQAEGWRPWRSYAAMAICMSNGKCGD